MRKSLLFLLMAVALSCSSVKNLPHVKPTLNDLIDTSWVLDEWKGEGVNKDDYMKGLPALNFREKGVLDGMTGCNSFSGKYAIAEKFKLDTGAMTKMNCPGSAEAEFLNAFKGTTSIHMQGEDLVFMDENDELLRFKPASKK